MRTSSIVGLAFAAVVALFGLFTVFGSWYTIDQTERGILLRNGAMEVKAIDPGLHFKLPWLDSVTKISMTQRTILWHHTGSGDSRQEAYSADQQPAHLAVSVIWHIPESRVTDIYREYGSAEAIADRLLFRRVPQDVKTTFGQFTAVSSIQNRSKLNTEIFQSVTGDPDIAAAPVIIDGVQIEDIEFSKEYIHSVEARMQAEVEVQKLQQQARQAQVQAEITVTKAKAEADSSVARAKADADSTLLRAKADADATKLRGDAEGSAIHAKGAALHDNPGLVTLIQAEKWNGALPTTMVPGGTLPMLALGGSK